MNLLQKEYTELENRRSKFINWLEFNINDKTVLDAAVSYFEMEESVRKATLKLAQIEYSAIQQTEIENKSLKMVLDIYNLDKVFNKNKSDKWLIEALKLVVIGKHTFDGFKFQNGDTRYLKTQITS